MAIMAQQYRFLNRATDFGLKKFRSLTDNAVYNSYKDMEESVLKFGKEQFENLKDLTGKIKDITDLIKTAPAKIIGEIKDSINKAVDWLMDTEISKWGQGILNDLKSMDDWGVREFLTDVAEIGSTFFCFNLDMLKDLLDGIKIPTGILDGLFAGLSLDWMDMRCKPLDPIEEAGMMFKEKLEFTNPFEGIEVTANNLVDEFEGVMSGYYNYFTNPIKETILDGKKVIDSIYTGEFFGFKNGYKSFATPNLKRQLTSTIKNELNSFKLPWKKKFSQQLPDHLRVIEEDFKQFNTVPDKYKPEEKEKVIKLLEALGEVKNLPSYSDNYIQSSINFGRAKSAFGGIIKKLKDIDLDTLPTHMWTENQLKLLPILKSLKEVSGDVDFTSRDYSEHAFDTYDFEPLLVEMDELMIDYVMSLEPSVYSYRYNGMEVISEIFLEENMPLKRKRLPVSY